MKFGDNLSYPPSRVAFDMNRGRCDGEQTVSPCSAQNLHARQDVVLPGLLAGGFL